MSRDANRSRGASARCLLVLLLGLAVQACTNVDMVRLTSETYPPKSSPQDVQVLQAEPSQPHVRIAELRSTSSSANFETMQKKILEKAAKVGADALVFSPPQTFVKQELRAEPVYSSWGFYDPYYGGPGPWGYGWGTYYAGSTDVPYDVTVNRLKAVAIRFTGAASTSSEAAGQKP